MVDTVYLFCVGAFDSELLDQFHFSFIGQLFGILLQFGFETNFVLLFYRFIRLLLLLLFTVELKTIDIEGVEMTLDLIHFMLTDTELVLVIYEANLTCLGI